MSALSFKTESANQNTVTHNWYVVDAEGRKLGRLISNIAHILRGKHKPNYTPHVDCGDYVIVINADKVRLTGHKETDKQYVSWSGYQSGKKITTPFTLRQRKPEKIIEKAVHGMLPKNRLGRQMFKKLLVYAGPEHKHQAQQPQELKL
ncbi:MAG: 50S ribosomal protein L13 [Bacteroidetes bacterium SW_11_45_7]|nr:MAG: 50S ribosomal protein L13 [Bacteroidetes bacterium SW_11_45_7]